VKKPISKRYHLEDHSSYDTLRRVVKESQGKLFYFERVACEIESCKTPESEKSIRRKSLVGGVVLAKIALEDKYQ
jgi:hypothetical protein